MKYIIAFLLASLPLHAATYYVAKNGSDSAAGGTSTPWLTIGKAVTVAAPGDTVIIRDGDYPEYVYESTPGTAGNPITFQAENARKAVVRGFRLGAAYIKLDGLKFRHFSDVGNTWGAAARLESSADNCTVTNCEFVDLPHVIASDFNFQIADQSINSASSDFIAAGFVTGSKVYLGACGFDAPGGPLYFTNHDTTWTVATVAKNKMTLTTGSAAFLEDTGTNYWAFVRAGSGNSGYSAVLTIEGGGDRVSNFTLTNNIVSNWPGHAFNVVANTATIEGNNLSNLKSFRFLSFGGNNLTIRRNVIKDCMNVLYYTNNEIAALEHPEGSGWYDYQVGMLSGFVSGGGQHQNVLIEENWFENVENQLGRVDDELPDAYDITYQRNVFVGVSAQFSGGRDGMKWKNNTFYKCAGFTEGHPLTLGGRPPVHTGYEISGNLFVACGAQGTATQVQNVGWYSVSSNATSPTIANNFVASEEVTGYAAKSTSFNHTGSVNGGDPVFYDSANPLGADGLPFTDDDGLKVLANSPAAAIGGGACGVRPVTTGQPVAHFRITSPTGWFESLGEDYDAAWKAKLPTTRGRMERAWDVPVALGEVPVSTTFDASKSISGVSGASTNTAINQYTWNWGDGTANTVTASSTTSHTFSTPGDYTVTLTVRNTSNATHSTTQKYKVTGSVAGEGGVINVPADYLTLQQAFDAAVAGDTILLAAGTYPETLVTTKSGAAGAPITIDGQNGATITRLDLRHNFLVIKNLTVSGVTQKFLQHVYFNGADFCTLQNVTVDCQYALQVYGIAWKFGVAESNDNIIEDCTVKNVRGYPMIAMDGARNVLRRCTVRDGILVDFLRLAGNANVIQDNRFINNGSPTAELPAAGNHPDFIQCFGNNAEQSYDHVIERNYVQGVRAGGLAQMNQTGQANIRDWTFRNNIFVDIDNTASQTVPGVKWYNNTFFRCNIGNKGHVLSFGMRSFRWNDGLHSSHPMYEPSKTEVASGSIQEGQWYRVVAEKVPSGSVVSGVLYKVYTRLDGALVYNGTSYTNGQTFTGASGVTTWTATGSTAGQSTVALYVEGGLTYNGTQYIQSTTFEQQHFKGVAGVTTYTRTGDQIRPYPVSVDFADDCEAKNNVFLECGNPASKSNGWYSFNNLLTGVSADYNYVAKPLYAAVTVDSLQRPIGDPGGWTTNGGAWWEPNGINGGNPGFTNESVYDFRLLSSSLLINAGDDLGASVLDDFAATARNYGGAYDIGAYEYNDGSPPPPPPDPPSPPAAPSNLTASSVTHQSVVLSWQDNANTESGFALERSLNGSAWTDRTVLAANVTTATITGLSPSTAYQFRVQAINEDGGSAWAPVALVATAATPLTAPDAPTGLTATAIGTSATLLAWTENATNETGLAIERSLDGDAWEYAYTLPINATDHVATGLLSQTTYYWRVRAYNSQYFSEWSNTQVATTAAPPPLKRTQPRQNQSAIVPP